MKSINRLVRSIPGVAVVSVLVIGCQKGPSPSPDNEKVSFSLPAPPTAFVRDIEKVNSLHAEISKQFKIELVTAARRSDLSKLPLFLHSEFQGTFVGPKFLASTKTASITVQRFESAGMVLDAKSFTAEFTRL